MKIRMPKSGILAVLAVLVAVLAVPPDLLASSLKRSREGEKLYQKGKYQEALSAFSDAQMEDPGSRILQYNISNTHYRMNNYDEALKSYQGAAASPDLAIREKAFYNLGNTAYRQGKLDEAIQWYQRALELDPNDEDAKFNLEFVRDELRRRIEEAKKNQQQQQGGEGEQQQQQQPQGGQQGEPEKKGEEKEKQQAQGAEGEKKEQEQAGAAGAEGEKEEQLTKEAAEQWLGTLEEDQKQFLQKQAREGLGRPRNPEKDW